MTLFQDKYRTESSRLEGWDYRADGLYFITICTKDRECVFGDVKNGITGLSEVGSIIADEWQKTAKIRYFVTLDQWIIMPNHIHGIIEIWREPIIDDAIYKTKRGTFQIMMGDALVISVETHRRCVSTGGNQPSYLHRDPDSIGSIIAQFKSKCTKRIHVMGHHDFAWQSRFYDHIIRNEKSLYNIRRYIVSNPRKWERDRNNPEHA